MRCQQVAFDTLGNEAQAVCPGTLLLSAQAAGKPTGQVGERR
ncbi:MAG: hypothetical protein AW07_04687 [Candidatus Accumulibacter sp. SK-11]|nr:MAG: hypothetical protein AW07_04687 [Candidatus Accumulibacter sp. SK-11]